MTAIAPSKPWDFTQVLQLINTLDTKHTRPQRPVVDDFLLNGPHSLPNESPLSPLDNSRNGGVSLGNFSKVWEYLGAPQDTPAQQATKSRAEAETTSSTSSTSPTSPTSPTSQTFQISPTLQQRMPLKTDYTSDGAVYTTPNKNKGIQWRDEANGGNLIDVAPSTTEQQADKLTKTQRKKQNRRERARLATENPKSVSDFESEAEDTQYRSTPASKASAHTTAVPPSPSVGAKYNLRARDVAGNAVTSLPETKPVTPVKPIRAPHEFFDKRERSRSPTKQSQRFKSRLFEPQAPSTPQPKFLSGASRQHSQPLAGQPATEVKERVKKEWPVTNKALSLTPAPILNINSTPTKRAAVSIKPKIVRTGADRNWALLFKLVENFFEDKPYLVKPATALNHSKDPDGIHIFVDASNIFIGFNDQLKRARNIPQHVKVPHVDLSFDALALLMERRRPVAKRVLAGSKPNMAAFDTAREIGYECSILDKVLKARELTERQKYFKEAERKRFGARHRSGSTSGDNSETSTGPVYAREAFVEQGVDEIIHLKMMESLVDTKAPSTMVLATGDAAQAEYSEGFMRMILRALEAGWKVEIVSWSMNISSAYKKPDFRKRWSKQFKIIELDDYAEELLDM